MEELRRAKVLAALATIRAFSASDSAAAAGAPGSRHIPQTMRLPS